MTKPLRGFLLSLALAAYPSLAHAQNEPPPAPPPAPAAEVQPDAPPPPATPTPTPTPKLTGSFGAGLSLTSGNSETTSISVAFNLKYTPNLKTLFKAEALYLYGEADDEKNVDKMYGLARLEYTLTKQLYVFGEVKYLRDVFKNIDYLVSPLVGVGYRFIENEKITLGADASIGAAWEKNLDVSGGSAAFGLGQYFTWKISKTATFNEKVSGLWKTDDLDDFFVHFEAGVSASVTARSELKATYFLDYKNAPVGLGIEKSDSTVVLAFVLKL